MKLQRQKPPATIKQIADRTGLSVPTVSHVLGSRAHAFRPETRERVLQAARELGYRPNGYARAVRNGRFGCIALLLSTEPHRSSVFTEMLNGIHDALAAQNLHLTMARLPDEKLTSEGYVPKILQQWMADGLLINYNARIPQRMIELIREYNIPSIWINSRQQNDGIYPDDFDAGRQAAEHLLQLGHRRIMYVDYSYRSGDRGAHYSAVDREEGYASAMRSRGLKPLVFRRPEDVPRSQRVQLSRQWLERADRPTAVVTLADSTAYPILVASLQLGLRVPDDLSIVTFGEELMDRSGVPIDTLVIPEYQMGRSAVQMLLKKIDKRDRPQSSIALPFHLERGKSCAAASAVQ